ncbi:MAG: Tol-Pal system beta propeller repeat protein TolB [Candidatus Aminicenantes bacterium]|nr:Tol-Pal system beta propeller repeat protein TolB [Candidatus Aminicenantes bacterium]
MKTKSLLILTVLFFAGGIFLLSQDRITLQIGEGMPAYPLAIPKFIIHDPSPEVKASAEVIAAAEEIYQVIYADLKYSRMFIPIRESDYSYIRPLNPENIFFKDWESIQAQILFVGEISQGEGKNVIFDGKLYDVKAGERITGKRYTGDSSLLRLMAHRMADEVLKMFGEDPLFQSKIAFISDRDGNDELYMMDYDGFNPIRLTFNETTDYMPGWTADGKKIAYTSYRGDKATLWLYSIYEGTRSIIFDEGTTYGPVFSQNGKKMAFCSTEDEGNAEIYTADSDGTNIKRLTFNKGIDTAPTWSPNSRLIAFTSDRGGTPQIYIMDAEGSNVERVSFGGNYHDGPAWSPTSNMIAYVSRVNQVFDIYVLNRDSNKIIKLTESNARNESPTWSPDGRHIIYASNFSGSIQLWTIDHDGANRRRLTSTGSNKLPEWSR